MSRCRIHKGYNQRTLHCDQISNCAGRNWAIQNRVANTHILVTNSEVTRRDKARNQCVGVCARIRTSSAGLVRRLVSFKIYAFSVLSFVGSVAEPDAATTAAEHVALQRLSEGPFHSIPSALLQRGSACGLKIDVDGVQLTSKAARFRVASQSAVLSTGMNRLCAGNDHCCRTLDYFARSWDDMYLVSSTAHFTTSAFQLVTRMDGLRSLRDLPFHKM